ncbi:YugN-like protein [Scopulibacillus darangshiensis]|uniref:YugN-like protein n=1 Tax=Scopulibacillus darangshiensis TaxID=442528 RepID=A0A4R2P8D2_9BACL|nr:YugN family protein [Scopulibacillus darangshiensis]TCP30494.1 YugN-like protein [Scopulibacillus darangshiensis]
MKFEEFDLEGIVLPFPELEHIMSKAGFLRGGPWDWERVTYDFKFENKNDGSIYYLRFPVVAVESEIERNDAHVKLFTPYLGKHYYPHGIEYDEEFPEYVVNICKDRLSKIKESINEFRS